ncbi:hypothetical protein ABZ379_46530 [Streptomyces canus]|uniref:hypothetical protein n=1 Tax=Streptomyces canus TaxID=58343 RepID=UPI0033DFF2C6
MALRPAARPAVASRLSTALTRTREDSQCTPGRSRPFAANDPQAPALVLAVAQAGTIACVPLTFDSRADTYERAVAALRAAYGHGSQT